MKKGWKIVSVVCALVLVCAVALGVTGLFGVAGYHYANAEQYTAGPTEITQPVKNLDVDWVSGEVTLAYHSGSTVLVEETANKKLDPDCELRWWLDGDTLRVRYEKEGFRLHWNLEKKLTVTLPEGTALGDMKLNVTSGRINAAAQAATVTAGATSGEINLRISGRADSIIVSCTSGNIDLEAPDGSDSVRASATSGVIRAAVKETADFSAGSTSGGVQAVLGRAKKIEIGCTSGAVDVKAASFEALKIGCTSGNVTIALPAGMGFSGRLHCTSGDVLYDLPLAKQGDVYVCGDGSASVDIGTTSGNIRLVTLSD